MDWSGTPQAGPLRITHEENWSQWLAHLIRSSTGPFVAELVDESFDAAPVRVRRERALHDEELHDRRVDVLVEFPYRGLTIEVKITDENYRKTPQTAYLTEKHHRGDLDWTHLLLLPESKRPALAETFDTLAEDPERDRPTIRPTDSRTPEISVAYWRDVSRALRRTLASGREPGTHWEASTYLFATLVEQKLLGFRASPSLEALLNTPLGVADVERLQTMDVASQTEYLTAALEEFDLRVESDVGLTCETVLYEHPAFDLLFEN